jgi:hypothetical protein
MKVRILFVISKKFHSYSTLRTNLGWFTYGFFDVNLIFNFDIFSSTPIIHPKTYSQFFTTFRAFI